jgi:1-acyl-sn-glycerol-3-phosphate acyltransferase
VSFIYRLAKVFLTTLFQVTNRFRVSGLHNIPAQGPLIVASNHISNWDPLVLGAAASRQLHYIAKEELFRIPILGLLFRAWGAFPVRRGRSDREAISRSLTILESGRVLGIFVEGTRNRGNPEQMLKPQSGVAMLAMKSGVPIVPALILESRGIMRGFRRLQVIFGPPIQLAPPAGTEKKEFYQAIGSRIVTTILALRPKV